MTRGKRRFPPSVLVKKRKKVDCIERILKIIRKYPLEIPSEVISEQKNDYRVLTNFKYIIFKKKLKGKLPEALIKASKKCPWFLPYFYPVKVDWTKRIIKIIWKYPLKPPSSYISEQQKKDYEILSRFKQSIFKKKLKGKLPEELIRASKDCLWFLPYFYNKKIDWTERIVQIVQKYPSKPPSIVVSEQQKKDYEALSNFKQHIFRKSLKGKLPEELIEASKKSPWFLLWLLS